MATTTESTAATGDARNPGRTALAKLRGTVVTESVKAAWRAATSDGQGAFTMAMLLFGVGAFAFHSALVPQTAREKRLEETAGHRQESLEGEHYPVLASLISPGRPPRLCDSDPTEPRRSSRRALQQALLAATGSVRDAQAGPHRLAPPPEVELVGDPDKVVPVCATRSEPGPAWTDEDSSRRQDQAASTLFVPSTLLLNVASNRNACVSEAARCATVDALAARLGNFPARSRAIESIDLVELGKLARAAGFARVSTYFISPEGATRTRPSGDPAQFISHYLNNGASYFFHALEEQSACTELPHDHDDLELPGFVTYPYLDILGGGLTETYCSKIADGQVIAGVLCFDLSHNEHEILADLATNATAALDLSIVKITARPPDAPPPDPSSTSSNVDRQHHAAVAVDLCEEAAFHGDCPEQLRSKDDPYRLKSLADWYYKKELQRPQALRRGGVYLEEPTSEDRADHNAENDMNRKFGVVVYYDPTTNSWDLALGDLRQLRNRDYAALILCACCVLAGVGILVFSYRRKMHRHEAYLARGLAYGLVRISPDGDILGANDRAEAILGVPLPRLGIHTAAKRKLVTFDGFIDHTQCVMIPLSEALQPGHRVDYNHVRTRSIAGMTTDFYAYLQGPAEWIRISTRIVVLPSREEHLFYALDSHVCAQHRSFLEQLHA